MIHMIQPDSGFELILIQIYIIYIKQKKLSHRLKPDTNTVWFDRYGEDLK